MGCCQKWFCSEKTDVWERNSTVYYYLDTTISNYEATSPNEGYGKYTKNLPSTKGKLHRMLYYNEKMGQVMQWVLGLENHELIHTQALGSFVFFAYCLETLKKYIYVIDQKDESIVRFEVENSISDGIVGCTHIKCMTITKDNNYLYLIDAKSNILQFNVSNNFTLEKEYTSVIKNEISILILTPDERYFIIGDAKGKIYKFKINYQDGTINLLGQKQVMEYSISSIVIDQHSQSNYLYVADVKGFIKKLFLQNNFETIFEFSKIHDFGIESMIIPNNEYKLYSSDYFGNVNVWDIEEKSPIFEDSRLQRNTSVQSINIIDSSNHQVTVQDENLSTRQHSELNVELNQTNINLI